MTTLTKDDMPAVALWRAVLLQHVIDATVSQAELDGPCQYNRDAARAWLLSSDRDFDTVCELAGFNASHVRSLVKRLAARGWRRPGRSEGALPTHPALLSAALGGANASPCQADPRTGDGGFVQDRIAIGTPWVAHVFSAANRFPDEMQSDRGDEMSIFLKGDQPNPQHQRLIDDAQQHWVSYLAECEDDGVDAGYAAQVLSTAAAMCEASVLGAVDAAAGRIISDATLQEIVGDFELVFLKALNHDFPQALTDETRRRLAALDRRVKRSRGLPTAPGGEA